MKKLILISLTIIFSLSVVMSQDIIYTISSKFDEENIALDSIMFENIMNGSSILFKDLPTNPIYQINLLQYLVTTGISFYDIKSGFEVVQNIPGMISIRSYENTRAEVNISIFNVNGQVVYTSGRKILHPDNIVQIELESTGVFFIKLESSYLQQTFKAIGVNDFNRFNIRIADGISSKLFLKSSQMAKRTTDFSFNIGDSLRIKAFKRGYYASEIRLKIENSQPLDFQFAKNFLKINDTEYLLDGGVLLSDIGEKPEELLFLSTDLNFNFESFINDGIVVTNDVGAIISFSLIYTQDSLPNGNYAFSTRDEMHTDTVYFDYDVNGDGLINNLDFGTTLPDGKYYIEIDESYYNGNANLNDDFLTFNFQSGNAVISRHEDSFTIDFNCVGENGDVISGSFRGYIYYGNYLDYEE